jgi:thiosulfate/3-mercaptopyruvate sulfurtransferase
MEIKPILSRMNRRGFLASCAAAALVFRTAHADTASETPWPQRDLIEPSALAKELRPPGKSLHIICVTFPVLYRQKHIPHAQLAGPANKAEGIAALNATVENLPKDASLVIYCGCCPMDKCPNIRPAYSALKERGFDHIRVLNLPTNFHTDWGAKGYPVEAS